MPAPNFDPVARIYRFLEYGSFGRALWGRRVAFLAELKSARRVLLAGEGDGRFLRAFLEANREARVDYLDASPAMAELARKRAGADAGRVRFLTGDALAHPFPQSCYDLIVTHFFLDCFQPEELAAAVRALGTAATPAARWVVSEFRIPEGRIRGAAARGMTGALYLFFGVTTGLRVRRLPVHAPQLEAAGFGLSRERRTMGGMLSSELWMRGVPPLAALQSPEAGGSE